LLAARRKTDRPSISAGLLLCMLTLFATPGHALEKYGRPLPAMGEATGEDKKEPHAQEERHWLKGYLLTSTFAENPTFAARPDNTGLAGLRHMIHLETDLYREYLQFYTDQNFFSDRRKGWIELSEWDATFAFTGSINQWSWRLQYERDSPLDKSGTKQIYADALINYGFTQANQYGWWQNRFPNQNLTFYMGGGWLFHNESYFARPDNTGRALLRYVAHADLDLYKNRVVLFADTNWFSDRSKSDKITPTELDWIIGLALRWKDYELSVLHERDMPLDRGGLIQRYTAIQLRYEFEWQK
jgi:hypothetical protein